MSNFRNELRNYQCIPRSLVFDNTLSDRARFVYVFMSSKPDDWDFYLEPMAREIGYSVDTLRKYIKELVASGWLEKGSQANDNGIFGSVEYTLKATNFTDTEKTRHGKIPTQHNRDNNNRKEINKNIFIKPSVEEISAYIQELGCDIDAELFYDFYEAKGWYVGKNKMKDWKAAVRTWKRNRNQHGNTQTNNRHYQDGGHPTDSELREQSIRIMQRLEAESNACEGTLWGEDPLS